MSAKYPRRYYDESAAEGIAAHELAASILTNQGRSPEPETLSSTGIPFTREMISDVRIYTDHISKNKPKVLYVENKINAPDIHEKSRGVIDAWSVRYNECGDTIVDIYEYKHGRIAVEAENNAQLINYASGVLTELKKTSALFSTNTTIFNLHVVQPRAQHRDGAIRTWTLDVDKLTPYVDTLNKKAHEALGASPAYNSGEHCSNCPGRFACDTAIKAGLSLYEASSTEVPETLTPEALGERLKVVSRCYDHIKKLKSGLEQEVEESLKRGNPISTWFLDKGRGKLKWKLPTEQVIKLGKMIGVDLEKDRQVFTPTQARKMGVDPVIIAASTEITPSGYKLRREDNAKARKVFKNDNR